jgi:hypothetical protein
VLRPLWSAKPETTNRLRGRLEKILDCARVLGLRQGVNPARWRGQLDQLLPARSKVAPVDHLSALPIAKSLRDLAVSGKKSCTAALAETQRSDFYNA